MLRAFGKSASVTLPDATAMCIDVGTPLQQVFVRGAGNAVLLEGSQVVAYHRPLAGGSPWRPYRRIAAWLGRHAILTVTTSLVNQRLQRAHGTLC